ncbi:MAG: hypothetical protein HYZ43_17285 [Flavobacteriia bacterium]|nr:hypothetical protein [Flavobacteriia bacterium]
MKQTLFILFICLAPTFWAQTDTTTTLIERKTFALCDRILNDPSLQTDHFNSTDSSSLPIGIVKQIGNVIYAICIDSAYYRPDGAYFNAYMAMDFYPLRHRFKC